MRSPAKEAMVSSVCWVLFLLCNSFSFVSSVNEEGTALLSFKQSIQQDPDGSLSNWSSSDENPCSWSGITCTGAKVVSLSIPKSGLVGYVPAILGSLTSLTYINLRDNRLYGTLPTQLFNASNLQSLILCGNSFSGSLPSAFGKLIDLRTLDLAGNSFKGSIPTSILQCKRLRTLDLGHNNFTGSLPDGFGSRLIMLEMLDLSFNQLSGSIPKDFGNLSSLQGTADLSHNHFSGSIPPSLGNLPEKVYIDLTYNNLSGPIPQSGALVNRGPTAFVGNPGLCGPPLRNLCTNSSIPATLPYLPASATYTPPTSDGKTMARSKKSRGLNKATVIAIVAGDVVGISLIGVVLFYYFWKVVPCKSEVEGGGLEKPREENDCLCFRKDESEAPSEIVERFGFVPLDLQVDFDIDRLLKSSAYVLGKSGIGIVYKAVLEDGVTLAVRRLGEGGLQRYQEFRTEIEAIGRLRHPNIVTLRAYYWSHDEKLLIYDYIPNGNLASAIHGNAGTSSFSPLAWIVRLKIMKGIAQGLVYIHEFSPKKYVHGNLKPNNILLGLNMEPYISDFGLGRLTNITGGFSNSQSTQMAADTQPNEPPDVSAALVGNPGSFYQAPEAPKLRKPSQKWDVYSYGVILLELLSGRSPVLLVGASEMDLVRWVRLNIEEKKPLSDVFDPFLAQEPEKKEEMIALLKIALACVQTNPERRPHMQHVLEALERLASTS